MDYFKQYIEKLRSPDSDFTTIDGCQKFFKKVKQFEKQSIDKDYSRELTLTKENLKKFFGVEEKMTPNQTYLKYQSEFINNLYLLNKKGEI